MSSALRKILFDLSEQMTREVYDLNNARRKYHESTLAIKDIKAYLKALGKRQKETQRKVREIIKQL